MLLNNAELLQELGRLEAAKQADVSAAWLGGMRTLRSSSKIVVGLLSSSQMRQVVIEESHSAKVTFAGPAAGSPGQSSDDLPIETLFCLARAPAL